MTCNCNCSAPLQEASKNGSGVSRRHAVAGAGIGAAALGLSACGSADTPSTAAPSIANPTDMIAAADVPVGGAVKATSGKISVIISQPEAGTFKAFSSTCTHQGCQVTMQKQIIVCPCHGSQFKIADGSVIGGPAPKPLPEYTVQVNNGRIIVSS